jgi:hypothetical protein
VCGVSRRVSSRSGVLLWFLWCGGCGVLLAGSSTTSSL